MRLTKLSPLLLAATFAVYSPHVLPAAEPTTQSSVDPVSLVPVDYRHRLVQRLSLAEENRQQWLDAIAKAPAEQREAVAFLLVNMPEDDLKALKADFLLRNVALAYEARGSSDWAKAIPHEIFLNDVLPYANLNERRDDWRADFMKRFGPVVNDCKSAGEAAQLLNRTIFKTLDVAYHARKRPKPDQSPYESIEAKFASCSGLSILLADACRAVGVPARLAGTPLWSDKSGNHTWLEVWDGQWRFVGAAEPGEFNQTWFAGNAAKADASRPEFRIYAASFKQTGMPFVLVWDLKNGNHPAVDVSDYYIKRKKLKLGVRETTGALAPDATIEVRQADRLIAQAKGTEATFELAAGGTYDIRATFADGRTTVTTVKTLRDEDTVVELRPDAAAPKAASPNTSPTTSPASPPDGDWAKMAPITPRGYVCGRAGGKLAIDGKGDEPSWADAPWTEEFADIEGKARPAPRFRTRAKMLWDDEALYVYAELDEPHVWGTITRKNAVIFHDNDFEIFLDPDGDNHNYYEFEVNPLNTIWELSLVKPYRDGGPVRDAANVEGLRSAVHVRGTLNKPGDTDQGWSVEVAIPWKGLAQYAGKRACPPAEGDQWRANFSRVEWLVDILDGGYRKIPKEMRNEDNWVWSPQGVIDMHRPERWGYVQFAKSAQGTAFKPDPTLAARDSLMTVYHRQREFQKRAGRYATTLAELDLGGADAPVIELEVGKNGYAATARPSGPASKSQVLRVSEDSKLVEE